MKFSVVIPLYNTEKYIERTVKSVLNQTHREFEIIVVDDGSTDRSVEIVEKLVKEYPQVRLVKQANKLVGAARNHGIRESVSEIVTFLDADDEYLPDFLETINRLHENFPEAGAYATAYRIQKKEKSFIPKFSGLPKFPWEGIVPSYFKSGLGYHPLSSSSIAVKKSVFEDVGYFDENERYAVDLDQWVRIASKYEIAFSSSVCAVYHRDTGETLSIEKRTNFDKKVANTLYSLIKYKNHKKSDTIYIKQYFDKICLDIAGKYIKAGNKAKAKEHLDKLKTGKYFFKKIKLQLKLLFA